MPCEFVLQRLLPRGVGAQRAGTAVGIGDQNAKPLLQRRGIGLGLHVAPQQATDQSGAATDLARPARLHRAMQVAQSCHQRRCAGIGEAIGQPSIQRGIDGIAAVLDDGECVVQVDRCVACAHGFSGVSLPSSARKRNWRSSSSSSIS